MKQVIELWAVIDSVTQEVCKTSRGVILLHAKKSDARFFCRHEKDKGNTAARVRRVKVTVQDA